MKKRIALLLSVLMIVGSFGTAFAEHINMPIRLENIDNVSNDDANKEVRVIVELEDKPVISHSKGKQYIEMPKGTVNTIERNLAGTQEAVKGNLASKGIAMEYKNDFKVAFNGFSGLVKKCDIEKIKSVPNVKEVYISNEYKKPIVKPDMNGSHEMIGNREIWGTDGYNGEGMVAAIIDTGIDPSHKDMKITNADKVKIKEADLNGKGLPGKYYTEKVPYGYNYFDMNDTIVDEDPAPHGMHVAGTVAANGNIENGGIKGVAPEAQLLAMKVFSNDPDSPSTFDDIYMAAIEDAIKLGVDVVNMSLGSPASFYVPDNPIDKMITEARKSGVLFSVSAGNEAHHLDGALPITFIDHPDIGMIGSPSLNKDTISVASVENIKLTMPYMKAKIGEEEPINIAYNHAGDSPDPVKVFGDDDVEVVYVGTGEPKYYEGKDVSGKIVLAVRTGNYYYGNIKATAQEKGAAGVLVRGAEAHGDYVNMNIGDPPHTIPMASLSQAAGNMLEEKLEAGNTVKVSFSGEKDQFLNSDGGKMSSFSSWGTTPTLDMKPEITAPGGQIYSTLNGDSYGTMSGTSMAAPHVTGGTALVLEYVNRNFEDLSPEEKTAFAKRLLMNTAEPILEGEPQFASSDEINEYSPRLQGAGLMRVDKAVKTPVTVVNSANGEAKVELRDFTNPEITMNLTAYNHTDKDVKYNINTKVLTNDTLYDYFNTLNCIEVKDAVIGGDSEVTVPANGSKDITVTIDLTNAELPENVFVEGFIYLEPKQETDEDVETDYPQLVVPYVGFYGDWAGENAPRVLDADRFDEDNTIWEATGMLDGEEYYVGYDAEKEYEGWQDRVAISPENEEANHDVMPVLALMRNAEKAEFNILDEKGKVVKKLYTDEWIEKTFVEGNGQLNLYYNPKTLWDGTVNGKVVEDGKYYYQIKVKPQYKDAAWQEWKVPVTVDTVVPEITEIKYDKATKKLTWKANDESTGINYFTFYKVVKDENDELVNEKVELLVPSNENGEYELDLSPYGEFVNFVVVAHDYAENTSEAIGASNAQLKLDSPEPFSLFDENKVLVSGTAAGYKEVEVTISYGENLEVVVEDTIPVNQITGKFEKEIELDRDGIFRINIAGIDYKGDKTEDIVPNRMFYVDTTKPEILETKSNVVRIDELSADEVLNSSLLLGGGRTIIFVEDGVGYAYDRKLVNEDILKRFNEADEKYVKLADGVFIDKDGYLTNEVPAVKYFEDKLVATIRARVKENFGELEVYANDQYVGRYGELSLLNPSEFDDWINFELELFPDTKTVEIKVVDIAENEATKTIVLDVENPIDEEATIDEIKDIEAKAQVGEEYVLPTEVKAILSNGSTKMVPVEWTAPEGIEIVDNKVTIDEVKEYTFIGTVAEEHYGGYENIKLMLTVQPSDKEALGAKIKEVENLDEDDYTEESWNALQEALTKAKAVLENKNAVQGEVDNALTALNDAIKGLVEAKVLEAPADGLKELAIPGLTADNVKYLVFGLNNEAGTAQEAVTLDEVKAFIEEKYSVTFNADAIKVEEGKISIDGSILSKADWRKVKADGDKTVPYRITVLKDDKTNKVAKIAMYEDGVAVIEDLTK